MAISIHLYYGFYDTFPVWDEMMRENKTKFRILNFF